MKKFTILTFLLFCFITFSQAQTRYVATTGSNVANDCSLPGSPCQTITYTISQALAGETIQIAAGIYNENCVANKALIFAGAGIGSTFITGSAAGVGIQITVSNVTIQDLTVSNFVQGIFQSVDATNITLNNVSASGNTTYGYNTASSINGLTISNSNFDNNNVNAAGRGLMLQSSVKIFSNISITNSTFNGNRLVGLDINANDAINNVTIQGNTVQNNGDAGISILAGFNTPASSILIVRNNSIQMGANQRFGIEIKDVVANGTTSGAGSAVVDDNYVEQVAIGDNSRDFAGIAIIRRSVTNAATEPNGIIITRNTIVNIQPGTGTCGTCGGNIGNGFGIVAGGRNHQITNNRIEGCQIGIQLQGGNINATTLSDSPSTTGNANTLYFDRDNSSSCNSSIVRYNLITGSTSKAIRNVQNSGFAPSVIDYTGNWLGSVTFTLTDIESHLVSDPAIATFASAPNSNAAFNPWLAQDPDDVAGTATTQRGVQINGIKTFRATNTETTTSIGVIQQGILIGNTAYKDILDIRAGNYNIITMVSINKSITLLGNGGAATRPTLTMFADILSVLQVAAQNVTIDNLQIRVEGLATVAFPRKNGIFVANHTTLLSYNNLVIQNNLIENIHVGALDFNAFAIRLTQDVGFFPGNNNVTIDNNTIVSTAGNALFGRGIRSLGNYGNITNNTITAYYAIQNANIFGGNLNISSNTFNVIGEAGIELNVPQQPGGVHSINNNIFVTSTGSNPTAMIEIKDNGNLGGITSTINISNNTFTDVVNIGVFSGHSSNIGITGNTFNPLTTSTTYRHIHVNTKHRTTGATANVACNNITIQGNNLNSNALTGGVGIIFGNHQSGVVPAFTNITLGGTGAGEANNFATGLTTFIILDPNAGASSSLTLWTGTLSTTMIANSSNFDARFNNYDVGAGLQLPSVMSNADLIKLEDKISHKVDYASLGFTTVKANHVFVTQLSFLTGFTTAPRIRRGTDVPTIDGFVINVEGFTYTDDAGTIPTTAFNMDFQPVGATPVVTPNWIMNGTGKALNLLGDLTISNQVVFTDGNITTNANTLVFTPTAIDPAINPLVNGEKANSRIIGRAQTTQFVGIGAFVFLGVNLPAGADLDNVVLLRTTGPAGIVNAIGNTSIACQWQITPVIKAGRNGVSFNWLPILNNAKNTFDLSVWRTGTAVILWSKQTADFVAPTTSPLVSTIAFNATQFSIWTVSDIINPLPVTWLYVDAAMNGKNPLVSWATATETGADYFAVERSADAIEFEEIGTVKAKGNSNNIQEYRFEDFKATEMKASIIYYRLRQVDTDKTFDYSKIVGVNINKNMTDTFVRNIFPNPSTGIFNVEIKLNNTAKMQVFDMKGNLISVYIINESPSQFDISALPSGMYELVFSDKSRIVRYKIVLE